MHRSIRRRATGQGLGPPLAPEIERSRLCLPPIRAASRLARAGLTACQSNLKHGAVETGAPASAAPLRYCRTCGAGDGAVRPAIGLCRCSGGPMPSFALRDAGSGTSGRAVIAPKGCNRAERREVWRVNRPSVQHPARWRPAPRQGTGSRRLPGLFGWRFRYPC